MSTEPTTGGTEPGDTQDTNPTEEVTDDAKSETTEESTESSSKTFTAEEKRQHIVDAHKRKVESGEIKLEEIEQDWIRKALQTQKQEEAKKPDLSEQITKAAEEAAQKLFHKKQEEQAVQELWDKVADTAPSKTKLNALKKEFDSYKESLGEKGALELAVRLSGINVSMEAVRRSKMLIHDQVDTAKETTSPDVILADQKNRTDAELMEAMRRKKGL